MRSKAVIALVSAFAMLGLVTQVNAAAYAGRVVGVTDGDTVTVLDAQNTQHKVRLSGIDAPERSQAFGQASKQHLSDRVFGKQVIIETDKVDRYGREVGKIVVANQDANLELVRAGFAWHYKQYEREQSAADRQIYAAAEVEARQAQRGLWREAQPLPPWEYRRNRTSH